MNAAAPQPSRKLIAARYSPSKSCSRSAEDASSSSRTMLRVVSSAELILFLLVLYAAAHRLGSTPREHRAISAQRGRELRSASTVQVLRQAEVCGWLPPV